MRSVSATTCSLLLGLPFLVTVPAPVHAQSNILDQAQRLLNGNNSNTDQQRAYEQGRQDEMRRQQMDAERSHNRYRESQGNYRDDRYGNSNYRDNTPSTYRDRSGY